MKKILAILLTAAMLLMPLTLVSCGKDKGGDELGPAEDLTVDYTVKQGNDVFTYAILTTDTVAIIDFVGEHDPHAVVVPAKVGDRTVTAIGDRTFYYQSNVTSVTLPDTITTIGEAAFAGCNNLTSVKLPTTLETVGNAAFANTALTSISFTNTKVTAIGESAFQNCAALATVELPSTLLTLGDGAFFECEALASVTIPDGTTSIGASCFCGCTVLADVTIPASVTEIGTIAFNRTPALTADHVHCPAGSAAADFFADETKWY